MLDADWTTRSCPPLIPTANSCLTQKAAYLFLRSFKESIVSLWCSPTRGFKRQHHFPAPAHCSLCRHRSVSHCPDPPHTVLIHLSLSDPSNSHSLHILTSSVTSSICLLLLPSALAYIESSISFLNEPDWGFSPVQLNMKAAPLLVSWHNENAPLYSAHFEKNSKGRLATAGGDNNVRVSSSSSICLDCSSCQKAVESGKPRG